MTGLTPFKERALRALTDGEKNAAWEVFSRSSEVEKDDLRAAFDAGYDAAQNGE